MPRGDIFTECPIIPKRKCQNDSNGIIQDIANKKCPEHNLLDNLPNYRILKAYELF